jgi:signal transduction histidine kinase
MKTDEHNEDLEQVKTDFVSLASHQLRTPLTSVNWYTELLLSGDAGPLNEAQHAYVEEIHNGNKRMVDMVNALLNVSRFDLGTFAVSLTPTDIIEMTNSILEEEKLKIEKKNITIVTHYPATPVIVSVDSSLMRILVQNLISNAVKYTPEKGTVTVEIILDTDSFSVKVSDTGYGIPLDVQSKVFSKLFRAENIKDKDTDGTGLGLYMVKKIIDVSGGTISFESKPGNTVFVVSYPVEGMKSSKVA